MGVFSAISKLLSDAFKERHGLLNPAPEVAKELKKKGYSFEFNVQSMGKHMLLRTYTIITPEGARIGTRNIPADEQAVAQYTKDYQAAVNKCNARHPAPDM